MSELSNDNNANTLALIALIISVFALAIAAVQLVVQWFTVDGLRQCSRAAVGGWSVFRRRIFRLEELRFEVTYVVPKLFLGTPESTLSNSEKLDIHGKRWDMLYCLALNQNSDEAKQALLEVLAEEKHSRVFNLSKNHTSNCLTVQHLCTDEEEKVRESLRHDGWMNFIQTIKDHWSGESLKPASDNQIFPIVRLETFSWDTMISELSRPVAYTTVSDLGVIVRSMGMIWKSFDPHKEQGFVAEGGGYHLDSTIVRGLGILVQFRASASADTPEDEGSSRTSEHPLYPDRLEDLVTTYKTMSRGFMTRQRINLRGPRIYAMLYGIWPGDPDLKLPDFKISHWGDCIDIMQRICWHLPPGPQRKKIQAEINQAQNESTAYRSYSHLLGFNDLLIMIPPMIHPLGSTTIAVPLLGVVGGLTYERTEMRVLRNGIAKLARMFKESPTHWGEATIYGEQLMILKEFINDPCWANRRSDYVSADKIHCFHDQLTKDIKKLGIEPWHIIETHLSLSPLAGSQARLDVEERKGLSRDVLNSRMKRRAFVRTLEIYLENAMDKTFAQLFREKYGEPYVPAKITTAWVMIYFRGICWRAVHGLNAYKGDFLPTEYFNSNMRVHLG